MSCVEATDQEKCKQFNSKAACEPKILKNRERGDMSHTHTHTQRGRHVPYREGGGDMFHTHTQIGGETHVPYTHTHTHCTALSDS